MKTIYRYIRPYGGVLILTLLLKLAAALLDLLIPSFLARIIDDAVPSGDRMAIFRMGGVMVLCAVLSMLTNVTANRMAAQTSGKATRAVRHDLFEKLSMLSAKQLDDISVPSAVSRLTTDTYNLNQMFSRIQRMGVRAPILLVGGIFITFMMDAALTLVLLATLPFIAVLIYMVTKKSIPLYTKQQGVLDNLVRTVQENITGVRVIKALSKGRHEKERYDTVNLELADVEQRAGNVMAVVNPATSLILNIGLTLVVLLGAWLVNAGRSSTGNIIAFLNYFTIILNAMLGITRIFVMLSKGTASAMRVEEVLMMEDAMPILPEKKKTNTPYHIEFRQVSFSYNKVADNLTDISFALRQGETLGILGATGSGKTTIVNLMMRLYDADEGTILLDGRNIRTIPLEELHAMFGVVFQNDFIMADTMAENIRYFRDIPQERLELSAKDAQAWDFISATKEGLQHTAATRGNNLSGGQRQRVLIARALAGKPDILILDDASSALDFRTDAMLRKALHEKYRETTAIIIAQRISSIKGADKILVLDDGRIIGAGTHEELMTTNDVYRDIARTQMGLEGGGANE